MNMDGYLRSESEERIANKGSMGGFASRNSQSNDAVLELGEVDNNAYTATVAGGQTEDHWNRSRSTRFEDEKDRIVKTVQLHQYSS